MNPDGVVQITVPWSGTHREETSMKFATPGRRLLAVMLVSVLPILSARADVYVAEAEPPSILVFASGSIGDVGPVRVITGPNTGMVAPFGLTVDAVNGELYVSDIFGEAIRVYPLDADGDVAPLRTLTNGPNSQLAWPRKLVVDTVNDEILVPSFNIFVPPPMDASIRVYARTASGDAAPIRSLFGKATELNNPIGLLRVGDELITNSYGGPPSFLPKILTFSRTASGDVAPLRSIIGPTTTMGNYSNYLAYDEVDDEIYADAAWDDAQFGNMGYAVFPRDGSGDIAPIRLVTGANTGLHELRSLVYDPVNGRVLVLFYDDDDPGEPRTIAVFDRTDSGDIAPIMTVAGPSTGMTSPQGIAIDDAGGFDSIGARFYAAAGNFDAALVDPDALDAEDFEAGAVAPGGLVICPEPASSASNNACFLPDQLVDGFTLTSSSGAGLALIGEGYFGNDSIAIGAVISGDRTILTFDPPVTAVAMDLYRFNGKPDGRIGVSILNAQGDSLGYTAPKPADGETPVFLGIIGPEPIARIELKGNAGNAVIDNLRFGPAEGQPDVIFAHGFETPPS